MELFQFYTEHIFSELKYLFFGIGFQDYLSTLESVYGFVLNVPHNGIQELVLVWGIPGLFLFAGFIGTIFYFSRSQEHPRRMINLFPFFLMLIQIQAGQLISSGIMLLSLSFIYLSLGADLRGGESRELSQKDR